MSNLMLTEREEKERKIKAIMAIKFDTLVFGSVAYWEAQGDKDIDIN